MSRRWRRITERAACEVPPERRGGARLDRDEARPAVLLLDRDEARPAVLLLDRDDPAPADLLLDRDEARPAVLLLDLAIVVEATSGGLSARAPSGAGPTAPRRQGITARGDHPRQVPG